MTFTTEQLETLSQWEENFRTAVRAQWARNPGRSGLRVIYDIYTAATGDKRRFSDNCNHCILSLLQDCGNLYFHDVMEAQIRFEKEKGRKVETKVELVGDDVVSKEVITEDALKKVSIKTEKRGKVKRTTKTITEK